MVLQAGVYADQITGGVITGEATSATTGLNISVFGAPPALSIVSPLNKTYFILPILLSYLVNGENATWYVLDSGSNTTLTAQINLTVSSGAHNLFVYANSSNGSTTKNVTFGFTPIQILYMEFFGSTAGDSTNFNDSLTHDALQTLSNVILENTSNGEIRFNEDINLTNDEDYSDFIIDIDGNVHISNNSISIDLDTFQELNKSAQLTILNVDFDSPQILLGDSVCPTSICDPISYSYSNNSYIFNVTHMGNFSIRETPGTSTSTTTTTTTTTIGGGGGGGGGVVFKNVNLNIITPGFMEISQSEDRVIQIIFENNGDKNLENIELKTHTTNENLTVRFSENSIEQLLIGQSKTISLFIHSNNLSIKSHEINIEAIHRNPDFTETETIYIKAIDSPGKEGLLERLINARELINENPSCIDLNILLNKANELLNEGKLDEASILIQEAITLCRDRIKEKEVPSKKINLLNLLWMLLLLIIIILIILLKLRKKELYRCKRCKHTWKIKGYKKPLTCPKCHSVNWNKSKKKKV